MPIDMAARKRVEDDVQKMVDSWPEPTRLIVYKYIYTAFGTRIADIDHQIDKQFHVEQLPKWGFK